MIDTDVIAALAVEGEVGPRQRVTLLVRPETPFRLEQLACPPGVFDWFSVRDVRVEGRSVYTGAGEIVAGALVLELVPIEVQLASEITVDVENDSDSARVFQAALLGSQIVPVFDGSPTCAARIGGERCTISGPHVRHVSGNVTWGDHTPRVGFDQVDADDSDDSDAGDSDADPNDEAAGGFLTDGATHDGACAACTAIDAGRTGFCRSHGRSHVAPEDRETDMGKLIAGLEQHRRDRRGDV